jgi:tetratricopeptide (TPR) repeat protein
MLQPLWKCHLVVCLLVVPCATAFQESALERANKALQKKDYETAIKLFSDIIKADPADAYAFIGRANAYEGKGENDNALADFNEAIRLRPGEAEPYMSRASYYESQRQYDSAIRDYSEAIRLEPKVGLHYSFRAMAYGRKRDYEKQLADYNTMIQLSPTDAHAYSLRGSTHFNMKKYDEAIADQTEAIRLQGGSAWFYTARARAYAQKKDYDKAIADYSQAIQLQDPAEAVPYARYFFRADCYIGNGEYEKAIADYQTVVRGEPKNALAHVKIAWLLSTCPKHSIRDAKKAIDYAKEACELGNWKGSAALSALAAAYAEAGNFPEAVKWQKKAMESSAEFEKKFQGVLAELQSRGRLAELAGTEPIARSSEKAKKILKFYEEGKPFRESPGP